MKRKLALYIRTATDEANLAELQRNKLLSFAELLLQADPQWGEMVGEYVDEGVSGLKRDRPGLNQMFGDIRQGKVDTVLVQDEARLSRSFEHFSNLTEELSTRQVKIHFLSHLTPMPSFEKTMNVNNFLGDGFDRPKVQKNTDQIGTDSGTAIAGSRP